MGNDSQGSGVPVNDESRPPDPKVRRAASRWDGGTVARMPTYNGPAVLVLPDGVEHDVDVDVQISAPGNDGPRGTWEGGIDGDPAVLWSAFESSWSLTLRAADGSTGQILMVSLSEGSGEFTGTGAPPAAWI
jgi:hypothetical protein